MVAKYDDGEVNISVTKLRTMKLRKWLNLIGDTFDKAIRIVADSGFYFASALVLVITLMVFVEAILRYGRLTKITFADELSGYILAAILFLSLATVLRRGRHLRVTFLVERLPPKIQNTLGQIQPILLMFWLTIILLPVWDLFEFSLKLHAISLTQLQTPQWIPQLMVVIGLIVFWLQALAQVIQNVRTKYHFPSSTVSTTYEKSKEKDEH